MNSHIRIFLPGSTGSIVPDWNFENLIKKNKQQWSRTNRHYVVWKNCKRGPSTEHISHTHRLIKRLPD